MSIQFNPKFTSLELRKSETQLTPSIEKGEVQKSDSKNAFKEQMKELLNEVDQVQKTSETKIQGFADGKHNDIHGTMISMQKADITFRLAANVRNKIIDAYREVMRMGA